jgi:hypothetical protein
VRLSGLPLPLAAYPAETLTSSQFRKIPIPGLDRFYLPNALRPLVEREPIEVQSFIEDDNRGAILPDSVAVLDGTEFFLSVKGIGSPVDPYSWRPLDRTYAAELTQDVEVRRRLLATTGIGGDRDTPRIISGELWLRGSPYGGQGLEHAMTALRLSERADLTSLNGFRIAPVLKVALLPLELEKHLRGIHWYRRYSGRMVQELRLVPSNVRVYFHARNTIGNNIRHLFEMFHLETNEQALRFEVHFVRSAVAMLTLFARTLRQESGSSTYFGLDFHDVWLDKDAVLAPDGTAYFVDLEGIEEVPVDASRVKEKIEDQVYRSLYEMQFAYEQIEGERERRFGPGGGRKGHFAGVLEKALADDRFARLDRTSDGTHLSIRNNCNEASLHATFPLLDS